MSLLQVIFEGNKFFWRTRKTIDLWFIEHKDWSVLEILSYEPMLDIESKRLYLNLSVLLEKIGRDEIENKISFAIRNNVPVTDKFVEGVRNTAIRDYVLDRLNLEAFSGKECTIQMGWQCKPGDIESGEVDNLFVDKPPQLLPYQTKHHKVIM